MTGPVKLAGSPDPKHHPQDRDAGFLDPETAVYTLTQFMLAKILVRGKVVD